MLTHLLSIIGLVALCAAWVSFQLWLKRRDPDHCGLEAGCGGCGGRCEKKNKRQQDTGVSPTA